MTKYSENNFTGTKVAYTSMTLALYWHEFSSIHKNNTLKVQIFILTPKFKPGSTKSNWEDQVLPNENLTLAICVASQ